MVLFSNGPDYDKMYKITRDYYRRFDNVLTIYYLFSGKEEGEPYLDGDILYLPGKETYLPGILDKTMVNFSYVRENYPDYDYYLRTNISTIVNINRLLEHIENEPLDYGGGLLHIGKEYRDPSCGIENDRYEGLTYVWGTAILFSKKMFKRFVDHSHQIDRSVIDDVAIGKLARGLEIKATNINVEQNIDITNIKDTLKPFIYRNKSNNRKKDVERMREIVKYI
jgi:hypothetical protein